jgi:G3E family GTPase
MAGCSRPATPEDPKIPEQGRRNPMPEPHDHHDHPHDHHHHHGQQESDLSFDRKLVKRLEHWITHNDDHARTYREWSDRTAEEGMPSVSRLLTEAAQATTEISRKLENAIRMIPPK